jgi:predicted 3-demethylubiquinone-9 3-methyltransferase (glyoxalase superfamily)
MSKITPTLWYDGTAEEAANFYVTLLPDSRIEVVNRSPIDTEEAANSIAVLGANGRIETVVPFRGFRFMAVQDVLPNAVIMANRARFRHVGRRAS